MAQKDHHRPLHLVWVYAVPIFSALDSATWLQTTQTLRDLGWQVTLIAKGPTGQHIVNNVEVNCVATTDKYFFSQLLFHLRVLGMILRHWCSTDVVLFHQISVPWLLPAKWLRLALWGRGPRFVMDTRDLNVAEHNLRNRLRTMYFRFTHAIANRFADGQTAITHRMAELVRIPHRQRWGMWPSGVTLDHYLHASAMRQWPEANGTIHLIYIGKLHHGRNLLPLCQAVEAANLQTAQPNVFCITLVGSGSEQSRLEAFAQTTAGRVRVLSSVSHDQIPELLTQAHIGVTSLPTPGDRHFEVSSPIKLFEYMAAGLPIFSTKNVCHTDVVGSGAYAFWADDATVLELIVPLLHIEAAKTQLCQLGKAAKMAASAWTWQAAGQQLDQALRTGLGR